MFYLLFYLLWSDLVKFWNPVSSKLPFVEPRKDIIEGIGSLATRTFANKAPALFTAWIINPQKSQIGEGQDSDF